MIQWITGSLATAPWADARMAHGEALVDVRALIDGCGNSPQLLVQKIAEVEQHLRSGRRVVVCCDYGRSRSCAIAAAALTRFQGMSLEQAVDQVMQANPDCSIKLDLLREIRATLGESDNLSHSGRSAIVVVGSDGLLGRTIFAELARIGTAHPLSFSPASLVNPTLLDRAASTSGANCLVHVLRPAVPDSNEGLGQALTMLRSILDVCVARKMRLIFLSGYQVFGGRQTDDVPLVESTPTIPAGPLGEALYLSEQLIDLYRQRHSLDALIVRSCMLYGAGDERPSFISTFVQKAIRNDEIITHCYSSGPARVELMHVRDFANGLVLAIGFGITGTLHLGSANSIATVDLAEMIVRVSKSRSVVRSVELKRDRSSVLLDSTRARTVLGWNPSITVKEGIFELVSEQSGRHSSKEPLHR